MALINVGDLFMDTVYADIIFAVENIEIPGHRFVLSKTSDYFGDLLQSKTKKVEISGISAKVFQEVMRFIYKQALEIDEWTFEDLMSLLTVAHEFELRTLFSAVIKAVEEKPFDFDSWPLLSSAASVYDSEELKRKCASFAEEKIEDFFCGKDLQNFSADFICCILDCPKMSSFNQDHVVKAICNWRKGQNDSEIMLVMQQINWETVSPKFTAIVLKDLFSTVKNVGEQNFWTKLSADIDDPHESYALNDCVLRVDSVVLKKHLKMKFPLPNIDSTFFCCLLFNRLEFWFQKDATGVEIPVKRLEFEASTKFNIKRIHGWNLKGRPTSMIVSEPTLTKGWCKYNVVISNAEPVYYVVVGSEDFEDVPVIESKTDFNSLAFNIGHFKLDLRLGNKGLKNRCPK